MKVTAKTDKQLDNTLMGEMLGSSILGTYIDKAQRSAGLSMLVKVKERVFNDGGGKNSNGDEFGLYDPQYLRARLGLVKHRIGPRKLTSMMGNEGKRTNKNINLMLTGDLEAQFKFGVSNGEYCLGFEADPNGAKSKIPNAAQKAEFMEKLFDDIFQMTSDEADEFTEIFLYELDKHLK